MNEQVLVVIKPDGMQKRIVGTVINHFMASDLTLIGLKIVQVSRLLAEKHYGHLRKQFFFKEIVTYLMGGYHSKNPVVAMLFCGPDAIKKCRAIAGDTNPEAAHPRSVRGSLGRITTKGVFENLVHVSSDKKEAEREIKLWFNKNELLKCSP